MAPLFTKHCLRCHQPGHARGDLALHNFDGLKEGAYVVPGRPDDSPLLTIVAPRAAGKRPRMPREGSPLSAQQVELLRRWIAAGAPWPREVVLREERKVDPNWWSLRPLAPPDVPSANATGWSRNPIDRFVFARLRDNGLGPAPEVDRRTLLRRLTYDLTGLPPTPEEVNTFVEDHRPDAYERLVERLLASPRYGERWGRHWLDVVRFGESNGFERNVLIDNVWPFRDYVVRSLNGGKPFDAFVREHLAGDALGVEMATAFLVCGPYDNVGNSDPVAAAQIRADTLDEIIRATTEAFVGMTFGCARCHDHKFDPITQKDYYRLHATFAGTHHGEHPGPPGRWWLPNFRPAPGPFHVFLGGSPQRRGDVVVPGSPSLPKSTTPYRLDGKSTERDRRLALANWIVSADNPLTPRVLANRLWHYHFGTGIVDTPSDFGAMGGRPTHPELLDWLAGQVHAHGWRLKPLHRLIVTSATYRQSAAHRAGAAAKDGATHYLWRFPPRRLSGEEVRDTMLVVAGKLDTRMGGPGFRLYRYVQDNVATYHPLDRHGPETYRRAIYHQNARSARVDLLTDFDAPDCAFSAPRRATTTTPLQALTLLNHSFTLDMATALGERVRGEAKDVQGQVQRAFALVYGRVASPEESRAAERLIARFGLRAFGRALFNSNEFLHLD